MEVSFANEIAQLRLRAGETFRGEGVVAVTKALLQSGVSYVGGYQGAPVSHLLDIMVQAGDLMDELGIHVETSASEAGAAAMLGASISYPMRGAVVWKSIVGSNVASDALSNLASAGVLGGVLIVLGEDYGEGASVIQERSHAFALKSSVWLLDPRPDLEKIVDLVEHAFAFSEASNTPVMMEMRIRACHRYGAFESKDNVAPAISRKSRLSEPADFDYARLSHPPATFAQERLKFEHRLPRALAYLREHRLNERCEGDIAGVGLIVQGGLYNTVLAELDAMGLLDEAGESRIPLLTLNVVHPLDPEEIVAFCSIRDRVLIVEEGAPEFIEQAVQTILRRASLNAIVHGKDVLPMAGEYNAETVHRGLARFFDLAAVPHNASWLGDLEALRAVTAAILPPPPERPPGFCTGCPERPFFSAMKLLQKESGRVHVAADIGCHALATFPPFDSGNSILGYGMSLASNEAVAPFQKRRPVAIMGDGGFWHNGLVTGVAGAALNRTDQVLVVLDNGYSSATGVQSILSSRSGRGVSASIAAAVRALGVSWVRKVRTYDVGAVLRTLRRAMTDAESGLKVIIAEGECMLARQRRERASERLRLASGKRSVRKRFGVDEDVCTGDHACIRLSGCPSLTLKPRSDPLRTDPVAHVDNDCVGCGLCGEIAHVAQLCPSFYRLDIVRNPHPWERALHWVGARLSGSAT